MGPGPKGKLGEGQGGRNISPYAKAQVISRFGIKILVSGFGRMMVSGWQLFGLGELDYDVGPQLNQDVSRWLEMAGLRSWSIVGQRCWSMVGLRCWSVVRLRCWSVVGKSPAIFQLQPSASPLIDPVRDPVKRFHVPPIIEYSLNQTHSCFQEPPIIEYSLNQTYSCFHEPPIN